jgi:hypothetical protein
MDYKPDLLAIYSIKQCAMAIATGALTYSDDPSWTGWVTDNDLAWVFNNSLTQWTRLINVTERSQHSIPRLRTLRARMGAIMVAASVPVSVKVSASANDEDPC